MNKQLFYFLIFTLLSTVSLQAQCPTISYETSIDACSGLAPVFTPGATCALTGSGTVVTDLFIYAGGASAAPAGYENTAIATGTCAANQDPFLDGQLSPVSLGNGCEVITALPVNNSTCDVMTVTYLIVASDSGVDVDMDGCADYISGCPVARFDVDIYPSFTVETTPGCLPSASLVLANGTVCATQAATAFGDCTTPFTYDFTDYYGNSPATGSGAICQLPPAGTVDFVANPPTITCPPTIAVECGGSIDPADTGLAIGASNCDGNIVTVDFTDNSGQATFGCELTNYTIERTFTGTDACGNTSATCTQNIVINDTQSPVITCPADATVGCGAATDPGTLGFATATDDCTPDANLDVTFSDNVNTDDVCNQTIVRTWVVLDNCGNITSCDQIITLTDTDGPTATAANNMVVECDGAGNVNQFNLWLNNNAGITTSDACGQTVTITAGEPVITTDCGNATQYLVVFTATDVCGNETTTNGTFTIEDTNAPVFTTSPISVQVECSGGNQNDGFNEWIANNGGAVASDMCGSITWTTIPANPALNTTCGGAGNAPITFVATDDCGNSVSVPAIYIVNDSSAPMFTSFPEDKTLDCEDGLNFNAPSTSDFCSNVTLEFEDVTTAGDCENDFYVTRSWTAVDECGNASESISQTIHFEDNSAPTIYFVDPMLVGIPDGGSITFACDDISVFSTNAVEAYDNCSSINFPNEGPDGNTNGINGTGVYTDLNIQIFDAVTYDAEDEEECGPDNLYMQMVCTWTATDACGNEASITIYMNMVDEEAPQFVTGVEDVTVSCDEVADLPAPVAQDNCSEFIAVTFTDATEPGCDPGVVTTRTWVATDLCGNFSEVTQVITIIDDLAPTFTFVPENSTVSCGAGSGAFEDAVAEDLCSDVTVTFADATSTDECNNVTTRTWTATDACGNTATATASITEVDTEAPVAPSVEDLNVSCASEIPAPNELVAMDDCQGSISAFPTGEMIEGSCANNFTMIRTWVFTDNCGNSSSVSQTININDTTAPDAPAAPGDVTVSCADGLPAAVSLTATDNCGTFITAEPTGQMIDGDCANNFTMIRTWTFDDGCGNTSSVSQTITVVDADAPVAMNVPANVTVSCADDIPAPVDVTATDGCGTDITVSPTGQMVAGDCANNFQMIRTWTFNDACGNSSSATQTITVADNTAPVFVSVPSAASVSCGANPSWGEPVVQDNCSGNVTVTFTDSPNPGCNGGSVTRTWTATDACGNTASASASATIQANAAPVFTSVPSAASVSCGATPSWGNPTVTDDCSDVTVTFTDSPNPGCNGGTITRTWTASDDCGNTTTASASAVVEADNTPPTISDIASDIIAECNQDIPWDVPTVSDNCGGEVTLTHTEVNNGGTCESGYDVTCTWTATDDCGNTSTTTQVAWVYPTGSNTSMFFTYIPENLTRNCGEPIEFGTPIGTSSCIDFDLTFEDVTTPGDCDGTYVMSRNWTATNDCNGVATCTQKITVVDNTAPYFTSVPEGGEFTCDADLDFGTPLCADGCGHVTETSFEDVTTATCGASYDVTRTWTIADACGNTTTASATYSIIDTDAPAFNNTLTSKAVSCGEEMTFDTPTATEQCGGTYDLTFEDQASTDNCAVDFAVTRVWTATDACGNTSNIAQTITRTADNQAPIFTSTPVDYTINCSATPTFDNPTAQDNCSQVNLTFNDVTSAGDCATGYTITRTWSAIDACGNEVNTAQMITIIDDTETTVAFSNVPADQFINCGDAIEFGTPGVASNCSDDAVITFEDATAQGTCASSYAVTRTWTAIACNITVTAEATITVEDNLIPTFDTAPTDKFVACGETMEFDTPLFSDNCSAVELNFTDATNNNSCATGMVMTRTWTIADACGNVANIAQTITREADTIAPAFAQIPQGGNVTCDGSFEFGEPVVNDNCSEVNITFQDQAQEGSCDAGYAFTRTWMAADACGNTTTAQQTFVVMQDNTAPSFTFVPANEQLSCVVNPTFGEAQAMDNCSNVTVSFEDVVENTNCSSAQVYKRTWTAVDDCGNVSQAEQVLTVMPDTDAPMFTFVPQNEVVDCSAVIEDSFGTPEAVDNCGTATTMSYEDVSVQLECGFMTTRIWTVADACGNIATASKSITVEDNAQPEIVFAPENKVITCGAEVPLADASFADNCDADVAVTFAETTEQIECGYVLTRTWTAVDQCANVTEVSQTVEVSDIEAPIFELVPTDQPMSYEAYANWIAPEVNAFDECSSVNVAAPVVTDNGDCDNLKYFVTWVANDDCGNATEHTMTIPITDAIMEVSLDAPTALVEGNEEVLVANVDFGLAPYTYDWTILEGQGWTLNADGNLANISAGNQDATFEVKVTDAHGCDNTTVIVVPATPNTITTEFFEILPNPTRNDLNINYTSELDVRSLVTVYDMLGRRLHTWKFDAVQGINNNNIDVTPLAEATYVITVEVGERVYHQKFVKLAN